MFLAVFPAGNYLGEIVPLNSIDVFDIIQCGDIFPRQNSLLNNITFLIFIDIIRSKYLDSPTVLDSFSSLGTILMQLL